ncbi:MAG: prepilin-type N-terminal cleavage/methylation domain-containing protein [Candidatus Omnitrophota bacterium]
MSKNMKIKNNQRGFSLVEICIIVVIIGILAAFARVGYYKTIENAKLSEAWIFLSKLKTAESQYHLEKEIYIYNCSDTACTNALGLDWPSFEFFQHLVMYGCPGGNCNEWWVTPFRQTGEDATVNPPVVAALYIDKTNPACRQHAFMRLDNGKRGYTSCAGGPTTITMID